MTLGRTPEGAIKTKSDGGLRAVNCACCGGCGCLGVKLPSHLFQTLKNATSAIVWGTSSTTFFPNPEPPYDDRLWEMQWLLGPIPDLPPEYTYNYVLYLTKNGCLWFSGLYACGSVDAGYASVAQAGNTDDGNSNVCVYEPFVTGTFSINGEGGFPYYYAPYIYDICDPPGPPNLIIT